MPAKKAPKAAAKKEVPKATAGAVSDAAVARYLEEMIPDPYPEFFWGHDPKFGANVVADVYLLVFFIVTSIH